MIEVAAGLIFSGGRLLITQRLPNAFLGGLWEFPGGKRLPSETFEACLHREVREELGMEITIQRHFQTVSHAYADRSVLIEFFVCNWERYPPLPLGCAAVAWVGREDLGAFQFPEADAPIVAILTESGELWGSD